MPLALALAWSGGVASAQSNGAVRGRQMAGPHSPAPVPAPRSLADVPCWLLPATSAAAPAPFCFLALARRARRSKHHAASRNRWDASRDDPRARVPCWRSKAASRAIIDVPPCPRHTHTILDRASGRSNQIFLCSSSRGLVCGSGRRRGSGHGTALR
jgi:hypothetical protein